MLVLVALIVSMSGGFRQWIGPVRLAVTSPYPLLLWALVLALVRHFIAPGPPMYRDLPLRIAAAWRYPGVRSGFVTLVGTRPAIMFVGYLAVVMIGYGTVTSRPPFRAFDNELLNLPVRWDAGWYLSIVNEGYSYTPNRPGIQQTVAFFPAYPLLVRMVGRLFGGHLTGFVGAGVVVSLAAFLGALVYLYALARDTLDDDGARYAVWLLAAYPFALFFGALYTESLFLLGVVGGFYHFERRQFAYAFLWGLLVGLTKTNGFLLSVPLGVLALRSLGSGHPRRDVLPAFVAASAPGIGMLIFSGFMWRLTGDPLAWLKAHEAWGRTYQGLATLVGQHYKYIADSGVLGYVSALPFDLVNALGVVFVIAAVWPVARRLSVAYAVYILVFILPPLAAGGLVSAGRFSSVLFPAFIWMAGAVPVRHRGAWLVSFAALQAFNAALFYTWRLLY